MKTIPFTLATSWMMALLISSSPAIEAPADDAPPPPPPPGEAPAPKVPAADAPPAKAPAAEETAYIGVVSSAVPEMLADHLGLQAGEGIIVRAVMPDGPAAKAGLTENDVITKFAGNAVGTPEDLTREVRACKPGDAIKIDVIQKGKAAVLDLTLGTRPKGADQLGMAPLDQLQLDGIPPEFADRVRGLIEGNLGELPLGPGDDPANIAPQMDKAMREMRERMKQAMENAQRIDPPAQPGAQGELRIQQGATIRLMDETGSIELKSSDGSKEVTLRDKDNKVTWTGPWDTEQDKAAAPEDVRQRIERLNIDNTFKGNGLRLEMRGLQPGK